MDLKTKQVESSLKSKGFVQEDGKHRHFLYVRMSGERTRIRTHTSHGSKTISDYLIGAMKRQMKLSTSADFKDFVDCEMIQERYEELLVEGGHLVSE